MVAEGSGIMACDVNPCSGDVNRDSEERTWVGEGCQFSVESSSFFLRDWGSIRKKMPLICVDLDGTLTRDEILPLVAREFGVASEMAELTELARLGMVDYEESLKFRIRLLRHADVNAVAQKVRLAALHARVVDYLARVDKKAANVVIVTSNLDLWVGDLCRDIGFRTVATVATSNSQHLTTVKRYKCKGTMVRALKQLFDPSFVLALGDGRNDLSMFENAHISIAVGVSHPPYEGLERIADHIGNTEAMLCDLIEHYL